MYFCLSGPSQLSVLIDPSFSIQNFEVIFHKNANANERYLFIVLCLFQRYTCESITENILTRFFFPKPVLLSSALLFSSMNFWLDIIKSDRTHNPAGKSRAALHKHDLVPDTFARLRLVNYCVYVRSDWSLLVLIELGRASRWWEFPYFHKLWFGNFLFLSYIRKLY